MKKYNVRKNGNGCVFREGEVYYLELQLLEGMCLASLHGYTVGVCEKRHRREVSDSGEHGCKKTSVMIYSV